MKDRRVAAFERVLSRRRQLDRKLNAALGALRGELQALAGVLEECRAAVRAHAAEQQAMLEAQADQAAQALAAKQAQIGAMRTEILRNRARIDIYGKRRDALVKAIELAIEDAQDEETSESRRPSPAF